MCLAMSQYHTIPASGNPTRLAALTTSHIPQLACIRIRIAPISITDCPHTMTPTECMTPSAWNTYWQNMTIRSFECQSYLYVALIRIVYLGHLYFPGSIAAHVESIPSLASSFACFWFSSCSVILSDIFCATFKYAELARPFIPYSGQQSLELINQKRHRHYRARQWSSTLGTRSTSLFSAQI